MLNQILFMILGSILTLLVIKGAHKLVSMMAISYMDSFFEDPTCGVVPLTESRQKQVS